jgi:acetyl esterase
MNKLYLYLVVSCFAMLSVVAGDFESEIRASFDAGDPVPTEIFKVRDGVEVHYFAPSTPRVPGENVAHFYIHGGGWKGGNPTGTYRWARYLAEHGVSAFTLKYRLSSEAKGIKPTICLEDAKSGMRWIRANAEKLGIAPERIAVSGNSAGGHLAAALATIEGYNHSDDDLSVATMPNLLLLGSPVLDNGPGGYGNGWDKLLPNRTSYDYRVKDFWQDFSPMHNLNDELPDTLVIMGDSDPLIKMSSMQVFGHGVVDAGSEFEWWIFPRKGHGLNSQAKSYLTPALMHIYYTYFKFLAKQDYVDAPLAAGDEIGSMIREHPLGAAIEAPAKPAPAAEAARSTSVYPKSSLPNLIVIMADDMGIGDIGAFRELYSGGPEDVPVDLKDPSYDGDISIQLAHQHTPNLDRLAKQGIRFTRAYSGSWCAPSRQMLLSGQWSSRASAYDHPWIGQQLREAGYVTGFVGKSHGAKPTRKVYGNTDPDSAEFDDGLFFNNGARGFYMKAGETLPGRVGFKSFDFKAQADDYITDVFTDHAIDFIERHASSEQTKPFMLYLPYTAPHEPLHGKPADLKQLFLEAFAERSDASIINEMDGHAFRKASVQMKAYHYAAMVYNMDLGIGRILDTLKTQGIEDNTLIIFTCDNGAQWGSNYPGSGHKSETRDGGVRVPFILWSQDLASSAQSGAVYNGLISLADIAPTLLAQATHSAKDYPTDGVDLMPYASGEQPPLTGRTWFWTNNGSGGTLKTKVDGAHEFVDGPLPNAILQSVYVRDDRKITCWNAEGSDEVGVVYNKLPDVVGRADPWEAVIETPPVSGELPVEGLGRELMDEMQALVRESDGDLRTGWTGDPKCAGPSWWFMN